ncbi:MAG: hypothetical protein OIF57_00985 [Marinobacterium sp.]|nr:hypothetical protein [Marinobacterium sp.]
MSEYWVCLGDAPTDEMVADALNKFNASESVTISLNAAGKAFVMWANGKSNDPSKEWAAIYRTHSQYEIAEKMNEYNLQPNCAVVSLDANGKWQLWGFVNK